MGLKEELFSLTGITIKEKESMALHTGYGVGGRCDYFVTVYSVKSLRDVIEICSDNQTPYKFIGNGTNMLFSDNGYKGVVISLKGLNSMRYKEGKIVAMCGVSLCELVLFSAEFGLYGGEPLMGIPATVGASVVMNAGAFGKTVSDYVDQVVTLKEGKLCYYYKQDCEFGYRKSIFLGSNQPIISVVFNFEKEQSHALNKKLIERCRETRKTHQPSGKSCGSVFKNPNGMFAGQLIESLGLKGYQIGQARISQKHANFIIAELGATASDIRNLVTYVKQKVKNELGVTLEEEVEFVGEF